MLHVHVFAVDTTDPTNIIDHPVTHGEPYASVAALRKRAYEREQGTGRKVEDIPGGVRITDDDTRVSWGFRTVTDVTQDEP